LLDSEGRMLQCRQQRRNIAQRIAKEIKRRKTIKIRILIAKKEEEKK